MEKKVNGVHLNGNNHEHDMNETFWTKCGFNTRAIHAGHDPLRCESNAVVPPIVTSVNFKRTSSDVEGKYSYARGANPTRDLLETCLASLEEAKYALTFASGLGAQTAILSILTSEDHVVAGVDIYGGTRRLFDNCISRKAVEVTYVDFDQFDDINRAIRKNTKMLWMESPTNPTLKVFDIKKIAKLAHGRGDIIVVLDNTFLTPYFQRPLQLGVDISMYSLSKYMNGHSDIIMGAAAYNDSDIDKKLRYVQNCTGIIPSPQDCHLVNRSLKTLAVRLEKHQRNSLEVAKYLESHPRVVKVMHPGLKSHPNFELFKKQASGHSGVMSFQHLGHIHESHIILSSVRIFAMAESLGGYESLIGLPTLMSHGSLAPQVKEAMGITENLIRLSIGLEDPEDLIADLEYALKKAFPE